MGSKTQGRKPNPQKQTASSPDEKKSSWKAEGDPIETQGSQQEADQETVQGNGGG